MNIHTFMEHYQISEEKIQRYLLTLLLGMLLSIVYCRVLQERFIDQVEEYISTLPTVEENIIPEEQTVPSMETNPSPELEDAEYIAKVIYGAASSCSEDAQRGVIWCIINRVESPLYPNSVKEVVNQPSQWIGYSEENPIMESYYQLAKEVLMSWKSNGHRPIPQGCLWYVLDGKGGIICRTKFTEGSGCNYWEIP